MSEDASPTGGQRTPPNPEGATDQNSSIIEKVRSRVTSIIPFSKWFSPNTGASTSPSAEDSSRNGGIRRRREETVIQERTGEQIRQEGEDSEIEDAEDDEVDRAPPAKRSRLNVYEVHSPMGSFVSSHKNTANSFLSSTPATYGVNRRKQLISKSTYQPLRNTVSSNTTKTTKSSTIVTRSISDFQSEQHDDDEGDTDILEVIPEHRDVNYTIPEHWERSKISSSSSRNVGIRELRLPTRRPSLHGSRGNVPSVASSYSSKLANSIYRNRDEDETQYEAQPDEEGGDEKKSDLLTNGIRGSPNMLSIDTASESGESQSSGIQKTNLSSGLYGTGAKRFRNSAVGGISYATHLQGKKSLFGDKNMPSHLNSSTTSLTSLNRRQSFNASLYGSTSALSDSRLLNIYSPFYKGSTTYGGASAYSKHSTNSRRINPTASFIRPSSSLSTTSSASHATESSAISNTAKRILELMNQFTTPLSDAKKMASNIKIPALTAHRQRFGDSDRIANRGIRMAFPKTPYSRPSRAQPNESEGQPGPPLNELQVPSMSQLLQMKKLHSSTERAREITRMNQSKCLASVQLQNEKKEYKLPPVHDVDNDGNTSSKHVNKIKNKLTSTRNSSKAVVEDAPVQPAALPDVRLPIKDSAVPKIDIDITKSTPKSTSETKSIIAGITNKTLEQANGKVISETNEHKSGVSAATKSVFTFGNQTVKSGTSSQLSNLSNNNNTLLTKKPDILSNGGYAFVFQAPIQVTTSTLLATKENIAPKSNFKFSDPVPVEETRKLSSPANNFVFQATGVINKQKSSSTANSQNISANVSNIPAAAPQLKTTGSVLDVFKKPMAAEATSTIVSSSSSTAGFGAQFKMSNDKWECSVCMVRNENSADKCVSCTTPKSTSDPVKPPVETAVKPLEPLKSSFGDKFKPNSDTWECPTCMIRNKIDLKQCEACNTAKPGATQSTATPSLVSSSSSLVPNISSDSGFKSIVAEQTSKWECTACMTRNEPARTKCACCEQAKPGLVSENVPQFSFGSTTSSSKFSFGFFNKKEEELKSESSSQKSATATTGDVKQSVTFGTISTIPSAAPATTTSASFSFGIKPATTIATATPAESVTKGDEPDRPSTPKFVFGSSSQTAKAETDKTAKINEVPPTTIATSTPTFKFGAAATTTASKFSLTPAKSVGETKSSSTTSTPSSSIFKPIGSMAFGASAEKKSDGASKSVGFSFGSSTSVAAPTGASNVAGTVVSKSSLSILGSGSQQDQSSSADSSSTSTKLFTFGAVASPTATNIDKSKPATSDKPGEFSFGSPSLQSTGIFKSTTAQKTDTTTSTITSGTSTSSFVFGKPSNNASITPTFGAISSNIITSSNTSSSVSTAAPSFGTNTASSGTTSTASTFKPLVTQTITSAPTFGSSGNAPKPSLFGTSAFGSASSSNPATDNKPASNLFQFGAGSKPTETVATTTAAAPIFGNVSSTTSARFSFGSNNASPAGASNPTAPFVFGGATNAGKPSEPVTGSGLFGSAAAKAQNSTTGPSLSGFGSFSSPIQTPQQQTLQSSQPSPFGQASTVASPFGSNLSANPPAFGAASAAAPVGFGSTNTTFGASGTTAFASPAAKAPLFGNGFGSTASTAQSGDDPAAKKPNTGFNFGAAPQNTTGGFSFNSNNMSNNNNNNKQAFSFSTASSPSFNFTGNPEATNTTQPFQFGAPQITPAAFNFSGIEGNTNTRVVTINDDASESKTGNASKSTAVGHPHKIMRWLKARNSNNSMRTTTTMTRTTLIESDQYEEAASTSTINSNETDSTSRQNKQKSNSDDIYNKDKDTTAEFPIVENLYKQGTSAIKSATYKLDSQIFDKNTPKTRYISKNVADIDRMPTNAIASTTSVTASDNSAFKSELTNSTVNTTTMTPTPTPRKFLISLRSRKLFTLNKQPKPTVSKATTTQRKLFYVNRIRAQMNGAVRDKSRYKLIRREAVSSCVQDSNESNKNSENEQQRRVSLRPASSPNHVQSNLSAKPLKSGSFRSGNLKFIRKKYNPSKFKYVRPAD